MSVKKEDFVDWRENQVTIQYKEDLLSGVNALAAQILNRRENNPMDDQYLKGFIKGLTEALDYEPDFQEED